MEAGRFCHRRKKGHAYVSTDLMAMLERLSAAYGPQGWWPLPTLAGIDGRDRAGYRAAPSMPVPSDAINAAQARFEIAAGAVLAQNTAWTGATKAILALHHAGFLSPGVLAGMDETLLGKTIQTAGTFKIKARYLKALAAAWPAFEITQPTRKQLLAIQGIGYETADCILLYCFGQPVFIGDAYARRILLRTGFFSSQQSYESTRRAAALVLPLDATYLAEAHALIDEHGKRCCRAKPLCKACTLARDCLDARC